MSDWVWVKNEAVNDIPGRIPAGVLPAWEARGWVECAAPTDDVEPDAPRHASPEDIAAASRLHSTPERHQEALPDEPVPEMKPSTSGPKKENSRG